MRKRGEMERAPGREDGASTRALRGRQIHLRDGAPWWPLFRLKVSFPGKVGRSEPWPALGQTSPSFLPLTFIWSPGGPGQTRILAHPALPRGEAPRFLGSGPRTRGLEAGSSGCTVLYFFGSWTLLVSLFCIKKKQIKYVFVFTVYLLYSSYLGLDIFIFLRGGWAE